MKKYFILFLILTLILTYVPQDIIANAQEYDEMDKEVFLYSIDEIDLLVEDNNLDPNTNIYYDEITINALPALLPAVIAYIVKHGVQKAVKKYGKSLVSTAIGKSEKAAGSAAKGLGYKQTSGKSQRANIYQRVRGNGPKYITRDRTNHNGGAWKGASTKKGLGKKETRSGTYDALLKRIGD